ncbi:MAG TPA: HDIG domain-containing protein [Candidatus Limnocylindrales bacterium]|nr:HDIG domain-containing protein [Candidatus Limnocylindrales bacterium]
MFARTMTRTAAFTRRDAVRLVIAGAVLIAVLGAILGADALSPQRLTAAVGEPAPYDVYAPRSTQYVSQIQTTAARAAKSQAVAPQFDYTAEGGQRAAAQQLAAFDQTVAPVDAAFGAILSEEARKAALGAAIPGLSSAAMATLEALDEPGWQALRAEMRSVLDEAQAQEIRDTDLDAARASLVSSISTSFPADQRSLAGEILSPLLVVDSTYSESLTEAARQKAADSVQPVVVKVSQGELVIQRGVPLGTLDLEKLKALGLIDQPADLARVAGWGLLALLLVVLLLTWTWRFRPRIWHRTNTLWLLGLLLVVSTLVVKIVASRSVLPFFMPLAAVGLLLTVLLDGGTALILICLLGALAATVAGSIEFGTFVLLGSLAGIVAVRRGERLANFLTAGLAMAVVNVAVVGAFGLLGEHDLAGTVQLWIGAIVAALGSAVVAVGTFALLGNVFGITTSFQLLELANPSQPLLRRLLLETSGTYHHSLMVGNLAEVAAEAIGADPLLARVGAYYHDIGKLANPVAFIENQGGQENLHDELPPEQSAAILKQHVADGIDLAYQYGLPKPVIAFIPQHHGTAVMSFFLAKAREEAVAAAGARPGTPEAEAAAAAVDERRYRHAGPKPQTKEAAILMLADGVEASVRSLSSQDEPAIRAMVDRIVRERLEGGQFDECDLTLRDVERIKAAFVKQLLGMYHRRIAYPQNKIVELESRRAAGGGTGSGA